MFFVEYGTELQARAFFVEYRTELQARPVRSLWSMELRARAFFVDYGIDLHAFHLPCHVGMDVLCGVWN